MGGGRDLFDDYSTVVLGKPPAKALSRDEDLAIRTIIGEAKGEGEKGWEGVADVIRNRSKKSGKGFADVVLAPNQFEPWSSRRKELESYDLNSPEFQRVTQTVLPVLRGEKRGPAGDATHFYGPKSQAALGRKPPSWDNGKGIDIGNHRFFNLGYSGQGKHGTEPSEVVDLFGDYQSAISSNALVSDYESATQPVEDLFGDYQQAIGAPAIEEAPAKPVLVAQPVSEAPETIQAQAMSALNPNQTARVSILVKPEELQQLGDSILQQFLPPSQQPDGRYLLTAKISGRKGYGFKSPQDVEKYVAQNGIAGLIGKVENIEDTSQGPAVLSTDPVTGTELTASRVSGHEAAHAQMATDQIAHPGAQSQIVDAQDVVKQRTQADIQKEFDDWRAINGRAHDQASVDEFNDLKQAEVDEINRQGNLAITTANQIQDLSTVAEAAKVGESGEKALADRAAINKRFTEWRTANNKPEDQASVDEFNAVLKTENEAKQTKSKADWLAKNPKYAEYAKEQGRDPFDEATIADFNKSRPTTSQVRKQAPTPTKAQQQGTQDTAEGYQDWLDYTKRTASPEALKEYKTAVKSSGPGKIEKSVTIGAVGSPEQPEQSKNEFLEFNLKNKPEGVSTKDFVDQETASRLSGKYGVPYDETLRILKKYPTRIKGGGEATEKYYETLFDSDGYHATTIGGDVLRDIKAIPAKQKKVGELKEQYKSKYPEALSDLAEIDALVDVGDADRAVADEIIKTETEAYNKWLAENSDVTGPSDEAYKGTYDRTAQGAIKQRQEEAKSAYQSKTAKIKAEYGSFKNYFSETARIKAQEDDPFRKATRPYRLAGEAAKSVGGYLATIPATLLEVAAISSEYSPIQLTQDYISGKEYKASESEMWKAATHLREQIEKDPVLKKDKDLRDNWIVNEFAQGFAQFATQIILTPVTGGAVWALPLAEGGTARYREADKAGASKSHRLIAGVTGAALAVPDMLLKAKFLRGLTTTQKTNFLTTFANKMFGTLAKEVGEAEARVLTRDFLVTGLKKGGFGMVAEEGQERLEDIGNDIVTRLTYKPDQEVKVFNRSEEEEKGYKVARLLGLFGGGVETVSQLTASQIEEAPTVIDEALKAGKIEPAEAKAMKADIPNLTPAELETKIEQVEKDLEARKSPKVKETIKLDTLAEIPKVQAQETGNTVKDKSAVQKNAVAPEQKTVITPRKDAVVAEQNPESTPGKFNHPAINRDGRVDYVTPAGKRISGTVTAEVEPTTESYKEKGGLPMTAEKTRKVRQFTFTPDDLSTSYKISENELAKREFQGWDKTKEEFKKENENDNFLTERKRIDLNKLQGVEYDAKDKVEPARAKDVEKYKAQFEKGSEFPAIRVQEGENGKYVITDGHRRAQAARALGHNNIEAVVSKRHDTGISVSYKDVVKEAIDSGRYAQAVKDGKLTQSKAREIIESAGLSVPKELSLPEKPKDIPVEAKESDGKPKLPPMEDNYLKDLSHYTPKLYRETSAEDALEIVSKNSLSKPEQLFVANTPNLAKGQGQNKGVLIEMNSQGIRGQVNNSKPGFEIAYANGEAEFQAKYIKGKTLEDNVTKVTLTPEAFKQKRGKLLDTTLTKQGWNREVDGDNIVFIRPEVSKVIPDTQNVPTYSPATQAIHARSPVLKKLGFVARGDGARVKSKGKAGDTLAMASVEKSPEFQKFFKGSKVVDEKGEPLVVYHATKSPTPIETFRIGDDLGVHLGSKGQAEDRADNVGAKHIGSYYVNIQNPLRLHDAFLWHEADEVADVLEQWDVPMPENLQNPAIYERIESGEASNQQILKEIRQELQSQGYDGVVYKNDGEIGGEGEPVWGDSYIAFEPNQIKSATDNSGKFDPNDPNILKKVRSTESQDLLSSLVDAPLDASHIEAVEAKIGEYGVELNEQGMDLVRRVAAMAGLGDIQVDGQFHEPRIVKSMIGHLQSVAEDLKANGEPKSAKRVQNLVNKFKTDAANHQNTVAVYIYDDAGKHEKGHRLSYLGVPESANKDLAVRYGDLSKMAKDKNFQTAANNWQRKEGRSTPIDEMTPKQLGHAAEEVATYLANGDDLGLTPLEADTLLVDLMRQYAKARKAENPRLDMRGALSHFKGYFSEQLLERINEEGSTKSGGSVQSSDGGRAEPGSADSSDRQVSAESETRKRSLPQTLRDAGLEALDETYSVFGNQSESVKATEKLKDLGLAESVKYLENSDTFSKADAILSFQVQTLLRNEAAQADIDGETAIANQLRQKALDIGSKHARLATEAGAFNQAAAIVSQTVQGVINLAQKTAESFKTNLTPTQLQKFEELGTRGENQMSDMALKNAEISRLKKEIADLKAGKIHSKPVSRKVTDRAKSKLPDTQALIKQIKAQLKAAQGDVLRMASKTVNPLAQYGASLIIDTPLNQIDRPKFYKEMLRTFGEDIEPQLANIFAESFNLRQELLAEARQEASIERLQAEFPDKTDTELRQELKDREKARKERLTSGNLAKKLAGLYRPQVAKQTQDVIERVYELSTDYDVAEYAEKILTKDLNPAEMTRKDRMTAKEAQALIVEAKQSIQADKDATIQNIAGGEQRLKQIENEEFKMRQDMRETSTAIARELRRITEHPLKFYLKEFLKIAGETRSVMASGDLSGSLRQGLYFTVTDLIKMIKGVKDGESVVHSAYETLFQAARPKNHEEYVARIKAIEDHPEFPIMVQSGIEFADAGQNGFSLTKAEENIRTEYAKNIPVVKQWLEWSERTYAGFLDQQRALMAHTMFQELYDRGATFKTHPEEFKAIAYLINVGTGRGQIKNKNIEAALTAFGNMFFAPSYMVSRFQLVAHVLGKDLLTMPPAARRIAYKRVARFHLTMTLPLMALAAFGLVSLDPDDDDFLKLKPEALINKIFGTSLNAKARYDFLGGMQPVLRFLGRNAKNAIQAATGQEKVEKSFGDAFYIGGRFLRGKLAPLPSLGVDWGTNKDFLGRPFAWDTAAASRLTPLSLRELYHGYNEDGAYGMLFTMPSILGVGVGYYQDKELKEKPKKKESKPKKSPPPK